MMQTRTKDVQKDVSFILYFHFCLYLDTKVNAGGVTLLAPNLIHHDHEPFVRLTERGSSGAKKTLAEQKLLQGMKFSFDILMLNQIAEVKNKFPNISMKVLQDAVDTLGIAINKWKEDDCIGHMLWKCAEVCQVALNLQEANNIFLTSMSFFLQLCIFFSHQSFFEAFLRNLEPEPLNNMREAMQTVGMITVDRPLLFLVKEGGYYKFFVAEGK
jgi:hypothetical protein